MLFSSSLIVRIPSRFINMGQTLHNRKNKKNKRNQCSYLCSFSRIGDLIIYMDK